MRPDEFYKGEVAGWDRALKTLRLFIETNPVTREHILDRVRELQKESVPVLPPTPDKAPRLREKRVWDTAFVTALDSHPHFISDENRARDYATQSANIALALWRQAHKP